MDKTIDRAVAICGGAAKFAQALEVSIQVVTHWRNRGAPKERCPAIERATGGAVKCEDCRPELHWVRIPDPAWPWHPGGRPLIDMMPAAAPIKPASSPPAAKSARAIKQRKQSMTAPRACPAARQLGVIGDTAVLTASAAIGDIERRVECPLSDLRERRGKKRRSVSATGPRRDAKPSADAERTRG